ncbi:cysteine proteinase inhibitor A-like [Gastrolobium bilobum]|uniref:cysteine proteinase inhibitor A-like n=1 Tax=Gastrolobium bilobum TaxID=150636 RepID=UPI002AB22879|nr:cysteine proteinase inhibitor A-like [Gastrolobium bilobum]
MTTKGGSAGAGAGAGQVVVVPITPEIEAIARFAVEDYNKKEKAALEFVRVKSAKSQVVAGFIYFIVLEANHYGKEGVYETKVFQPPGSGSKEVEEFKKLLLTDAPSESSIY